MRAEARAGVWSRAATGLILLAAGVVFWLDQIDHLDVRDYFDWWPLAPIAIGLAHLLDRRLGAGLVWIGIGAFFLVPQLGYDRPSAWMIIAAWPLFISVAGVTLIINALRPRPRNPSGSPGFHVVAFMGGNVRRIVTPTTGGEATAIMAGCEIEIAPEALIGSEIVIDVLTMWGGVVLRIPRGWRVVNQVAVVIGSFDDRTDRATDDAPRVVIRGSAVMAGVEVRNA